MVAYADTSFLVSLYGRDTNSAAAQALAASLPAPLAFTLLLRHEARNAIRLAVFRKDISVDECARVIAAIEADVQNGTLVRTTVAWMEVYAEADLLSAAHTGAIGARASDVLHVASAAVLGAKSFLTFDANQKALAAKAGLKVRL